MFKNSVIVDMFCLNKLNFSILSWNFRSDLISKRKQVTSLRFYIESKRNIAFYSGLYVRERKTIMQCSMFQFSYGRKERNIRFFMIESRKLIVFDPKKTKRWHHYSPGTVYFMAHSDFWSVSSIVLNTPPFRGGTRS
jgi:hypothetical protein